MRAPYLIDRVLKMDVEVPHGEGGAFGGARLPCHLEIIHPRCTGRGDVDPHDIELLVFSDELDGQKF